MDRNLIASELLKAAKEMTAEGPSSSDYDSYLSEWAKVNEDIIKLRRSLDRFMQSGKVNDLLDGDSLLEGFHDGRLEPFLKSLSFVERFDSEIKKSIRVRKRKV